jgi:hypothetical protein
MSLSRLTPPGGLLPHESAGEWGLQWQWRTVGGRRFHRRIVWLAGGCVLFLFVALRRAGTPVGLALTTLGLALAATAAWHLLAVRLNHTRLTVTRQGLRVTHGPLPWPGGRTLEGSTLHALHPTEVDGQWQIEAEHLDAGRTVILEHLPSSAHAQFICQELGRRLLPSPQNAPPR